MDAPAPSAFSSASLARLSALPSFSESFFASSSSGLFAALASSPAFSAAYFASSSALAFTKASAYASLLQSSGISLKNKEKMQNQHIFLSHAILNLQ
ncbi:hypothetical protein V6N12_072476 [Hibiscus sabdariffa]|uniref:Uncharacterized protein n=1 Tax=Hibiscus sabdariffa TaxID=183260 RepID=A0ABR2FMV0_9ROSI